MGSDGTLVDGLCYVSLGCIGAGFDTDSLERAMARRPAFIGADAGSNDVGPYQLGGVGTLFSETACARDLRLALRAARAAGVPLLVGSSGGSGRDWGVDWFAGLIRQAAKEEGLETFTLAKIYSEVEQDMVVAKLTAGKVTALAPEWPYNEDIVRSSERVVAVLGAEPFIEAIRRGADVVLAGRASDTSIFAAVPLLKGIPERVAWPAGKAAESGAAATIPPRMDCVVVTVDDAGFTIEPANPKSICTPLSVAAAQLYENGDPTRFIEPSGVIDNADLRYEALDDRIVRVTGASFVPRPYTNKLEGVTLAGYQSIVMASLRDPVAVSSIDETVEALPAAAAARVNRAFGQDMTSLYTMTVRVYGRSGTMGVLDPGQGQPSEVFILIDVVAADQPTAAAIANLVWHTTIHFECPGWKGGMTTAAWPFSPPVLDRGPVYRWNVNHVVEVDDPLELCRIELEEVG